MLKKTLTLAVLLALGLSACGKGEKPEGKDKAAAAKAVPQLAASDLLTAQTGTVQETVPFTATLNAKRSAEVAAEVEGQVREVLVREGEPVRRGQRLALIDGQTLEQALAEQRAQLSNAESRLKLARQKLEKQRELFRQGFISQLALDELESDYRIREGEVHAQRSQLSRAQKSLADTVISAPMDGVLYSRQIEPGEQVGRNQKVFGIADLSTLEAVANIPARQVAELKPGMTASFHLEGGKQQYSATLQRINPVANANTRTFAAYLQVANNDLQLKAGQFIQGELVLREQQGIALPLAAVRDADGKTPWVMTLKGNQLGKQPVQILLRNDARRTVAVSGLAAGQQILAAPLLGLQSGDKVQLPGKGS